MARSKLMRPLTRSTCFSMRSAELGHSQAELAELLGSRSHASEVLSRRRALAVEMIHKIGEGWKIPSDLVRLTRSSGPPESPLGHVLWQVSFAARRRAFDHQRLWQRAPA
jgi:transcriptional regulator with XRE-family HTH domain